MESSTIQSPPGAIGGFHESLKEMEEAFNKVKADVNSATREMAEKYQKIDALQRKLSESVREKEERAKEASELKGQLQREKEERAKEVSELKGQLQREREERAKEANELKGQLQCEKEERAKEVSGLKGQLKEENRRNQKLLEINTRMVTAKDNLLELSQQRERELQVVVKKLQDEAKKAKEQRKEPRLDERQTPKEKEAEERRHEPGLCEGQTRKRKEATVQRKEPRLDERQTPKEKEAEERRHEPGLGEGQTRKRKEATVQRKEPRLGEKQAPKGKEAEVPRNELDEQTRQDERRAEHGDRLEQRRRSDSSLGGAAAGARAGAREPEPEPEPRPSLLIDIVNLDDEVTTEHRGPSPAKRRRSDDYRATRSPSTTVQHTATTARPRYSPAGVPTWTPPGDAAGTSDEEQDRPRPPPLASQGSVRDSQAEGCYVCTHDDMENELVSCSQCQKAAHQYCLSPADRTGGSSSYNWLCIDCRICPTCHSSDADTRQFVFCDGCDNGYHKDCHTPPADDDCVAWFCANCSNQPAMSPAGRFMALTFLFRVLSHSRAVAYLFPPVDRWPEAFGMPEKDVQEYRAAVRHPVDLASILRGLVAPADDPAHIRTLERFMCLVYNCLSTSVARFKPGDEEGIHKTCVELLCQLRKALPKLRAAAMLRNHELNNTAHGLRNKFLGRSREVVGNHSLEQFLRFRAHEAYVGEQVSARRLFQLEYNGGVNSFIADAAKLFLCYHHNNNYRQQLRRAFEQCLEEIEDNIEAAATVKQEVHV